MNPKLRGLIEWALISVVSAIIWVVTPFPAHAQGDAGTLLRTPSVTPVAGLPQPALPHPGQAQLETSKRQLDSE